MLGFDMQDDKCRRVAVMTDLLTDRRTHRDGFWLAI